MNERRMSLGNRVISLVLALVMVIGMMPAGLLDLSVFAADSSTSTTATSVEAIRNYASSMLNSNFSKAASEDSEGDDAKDDKFSWDTEGKTTNWRYYTGVMLDALLMLGVDSNAGNALEFAKDFSDTNTENSDSKAVTWFIAKELDSVPPALVLFDLLDTAEVSEADRTIYVKAINYVYKQLENQTKYSNCGGNFLHKMDNDDWATWNIGLDGIYMAQPFLMEYAHALAAGKITNTVNSKTASDIYKEVYDRLMWVADNMYDSNTGLYHHGWNVEDSKGNGHFWSRGIGWYAAGLVMCIDLMPAGSYKNDLIGKLPKLFDGMIKYQDATGLWYNVVDRDSSLTDKNGNKLETSGTALMAFAIMKAVNKGWVADSKYAPAGLAAFNGIVANKMSGGKINDIYKSSGVCTSDGDYCKNAYVSDEAKGVGPVIMAAAEAAKYLGGNETFTTGVVVAPSNMTIAAGSTTVDTSKVKVSLLGSQGSIANGVANRMNYVVGTANSNGKATVTVKNGDATIGTFQVNVVDPSVPAEGEGTLGIEGEAVTAPNAPSFSAGDFVLVKAASEGNGAVTYELYTGDYSGLNGKTVLIVDESSKVALMNPVSSNSSIKGATEEITFNTDKTAVTISDTNAEKCEWLFTSSTSESIPGSLTKSYARYTVSNKDGSTTYYLYNNDKCVYKGSSDTVFVTDYGTGNELVLAVNLAKTDGKGDKVRAIYCSGSDWARSSEVTWNTDNSVAEDFAVLLYEKKVGSAEPIPAVYAKLTGSEGLVYTLGKDDAEIISAIKDSSAFSVLVADNEEGTDAETVAMGNSLVTVVAPSGYNANTAGTYNFVVNYDGKELGTVPVVLYDDNSNVTNYDVDLSVTPGAIVATVGDANKQLNATVLVSELSGYGSVVKYSGGSDSVATVTEDGLVTIVGEGSTTITATVTAITYGGKTYTSANFGTITATIPVLVTDGSEHIHSYTSAVTKAATCTVAGVRTYTCSGCEEGTEGHSYTEAIAPTGHSWNAGEVTENATCNAAGTKTFTCTVCNTTKTEPVAATGNHTYGDDNVCDVCQATKPSSNVSVTTGGEETTNYLVEATAQGLTVEAGSSVDPAVTLTGKDMEGADVTVDGTWSYDSDDSGIAVYENGKIKGVSVGTTTITATLQTVKVNGNNGDITTPVTVSFTVEVTEESVTPPVPGGTWTHLFETNGMTDTDYYDFSTDASDLTTSHGTVAIDGQDYTKALKINSKGSVVFTTEGAGTLTLISQSKNSDASLLLVGSNGSSFVVPMGTTTYPLAAGVTYTVKQNNKESGLYYISYTEVSGDVEITSGSLVSNATEVAHNGTVNLSALKLNLFSETGVLLDTVNLTDSDVTFGENKQSFTNVVNTANPGEYQVKVWYGDIDCGTLTVTVNEAEVDASQYALSVRPSEITIDLSSGTTTGSITASVTKNDAATTDCTITFTSDNESVAKVGTDGTVTGISAGSAEITVTAKVGSTVVGTQTVKVTVTGSTSGGNISVEKFEDATVAGGVAYVLLGGAPANNSVFVFVDASGNVLMNSGNDRNAVAYKIAYTAGVKTITLTENAEHCEWLSSSFSGADDSRKTASFKNGSYYISSSDTAKALNTSTDDIYLNTTSKYEDGLVSISTSKRAKPYLYYDEYAKVWKWSDTTETKLYAYVKSTSDDPANITFGVTESMTLGIDASKTPSYIVTLDGTSYTVDGTDTVVELEVTSGESYAKVENGQIVGIKEGSANVTAKLVKVNGKEVTSNVTDTIAVKVQNTPTVYSLSQGVLHVRKNGYVDLKNIKIYADGEQSATAYFDLAGATGKPDDKKGVSTDLDKLGVTADTLTYNVPIIDNGEQLTAADGTPLYLKLIVHNDEFYGLGDPVTENPPEGVAPLPEYPDAGGVRIDKTAEGINFSQTGIAKVELDIAGVAKESNVDVILIVDVSNSMAWSMDWFKNMTDSQVAEAKDANKIPSDASSTTDKLDMAMTYASQFANILLGSNTGNTLSFVTFASGSSNSDKVVFTGKGYDDLESTVTQAFANTMFTKYVASDSGSVTYTLKINGGDTFENKGGTDYDSAFSKAQAAITELKDQYAEANPGKTYADSGREIRVVFMTDGAPQTYNDESIKGLDVDKQVDYLKNHYHIGATNLFEDDAYGITKMYAVGFDLAHGGYTGFTSAATEDDLIEVVAGMVKNELVETSLAKNEGELQRFFYDLGRALAYAGTEAYVEDTLGSDFNLITDAIDLNADGRNDDNRIELGFYKLYTSADVGTTGYRLDENGEVEDFEVTLDDIGLRKMNSEGGYEYTAIETVYLNGVNTHGTYRVKDLQLDETNNTLSEVWVASNANRTYYYNYGTSMLIDGYYFDYRNDGTKEWFDWDVGDITDAEIVLTYYERLAEEGVDGKIYDTNDAAYVDYVTIYERHAHLTFPVPQLAYGKATINVRFYLVNEQGQFTNRANAVFEEEANRVFLPNTYTYSQGYCSTFEGSVAQAMIDANLDNAVAFDASATFAVTNTVEHEDGISGSGTVEGTKDKIEDLLKIVGTGDYHQVTVEIPVILKDLGQSSQRMAVINTIIDFGKPIDINVFSDTEKTYLQDYEDPATGILYNATVEGFALYNEDFDLTKYVPVDYAKATLETENGTYRIINKSGTIEFTPNGPMNGVEKVFVGIKFSQSKKNADGEWQETSNYYFMLKEVNIIPATSVYYETDIEGAFATTGGWTTEEGGTVGGAKQDSGDKLNDLYGYDSSYANCDRLSNGTSLFVNNTTEAVNRPTVTFTFTGTGIDIISRTGANQGLVQMTITNANGEQVKSVLVLNKGIDELYQLPVMSVEGLEYGTYTATIEVYKQPKHNAYGGQFSFDAIRVYGTAQETDVVDRKLNDEGKTETTCVGDLYKADGESKPQLMEIRDILLGNKNFGDITAAGVNGAVYIDGNSTLGDESTNFNNYDKIGPNNEVYLSNNQAVAFKLRAKDTNLPASLDIGLKSVNGSVNATVYVITGTDDNTNTYTYTHTVGSATAMFYDLLTTKDPVTGKAVSNTVSDFLGTNQEFTVVIANKDTNGTILSVTDLKVGYGNAAGEIETVVDTSVGSLAQDALAASAQVVSVTIDNVDPETGNAIAYTMQDTTIVVVTGQDAQGIQIVDSKGNEVTRLTTYVDNCVDNEKGARRWSIHVKFTNVKVDTYTVYAVGTNGKRHQTSQQITVDIRQPVESTHY